MKDWNQRPYALGSSVGKLSLAFRLVNRRSMNLVPIAVGDKDCIALTVQFGPYFVDPLSQFIRNIGSRYIIGKHLPALILDGGVVD